MGINHDKLVLDWSKNVSCSSSEQPDDKDEGCASCDNNTDEDDDDHQELDIELIPGAGEECGLPTDQVVIIVGDNWDRNIKPRDMRMNKQVKSLHFFHVIAIVSRVKTLH